MSIPISRRTILGTAAALAMPVGLNRAARAAEDAAHRIQLRLLETSDLHMFVMDWDYYHAKPDPTVGLVRTASLIRAARAENPNTLLFDNGDLLQGNPLADYIVEQQGRSGSAAPHPMLTVMASLGYDAATPGNHEFNFGLDFLETTLSGSAFPFVCANVRRVGGGEFLPPYRVLKRQFKDTSGVSHELRIGVIGFLPPQIMAWDKARLDGRLQASDIVLAARHYLPELRATSDVVVALCHAGINTGAWVEGEEHAAYHLATVPGIDVLMTGHAHRVFPGRDFTNQDGVDPEAGRLNGVPTIMPGFWGNHLGLADLTLKRDGDRWTVEAAHVEVRPIYRRTGDRIEELAAPDPEVARLIAPAHKGTMEWVAQPVGAIDAPVHSYFVWAGYDPATALVNAAQSWYARPLLASAGFGELPLLSSMSPMRVGYTPDAFIDIAAGPVARRDVADLYIYSSNTLTVLKATGAQILEWLEYSARIFHTIKAGEARPQALVDRHLPSYNFDILAGLTYEIDVTQPRYGTEGATARRIANLRFEGTPVAPEREFAVITNSYRADGKDKIPGLANASIIMRAPDTNRDAIMHYFGANPAIAVPKACPWSFAKIGQATPVYFDTGKNAVTRLADVPGLTLLGEGEPGYARVGFTLA